MPKFSLLKRIKSFSYAFNGLLILFKEEHNARIHLFGAIVTTAAGFYFEISKYEWLALILVIGLVITLEIINSAIEGIADFISPNYHEMIKKIKDLGAAAVLTGAITAMIIGGLIFIPKVLTLLLNH